ncbi:MAG: hypothetical protein JWO36_7052 [Myxococcales bacterium]|nr:hypothetical protein [Myxococcales bacterium]
MTKLVMALFVAGSLAGCKKSHSCETSITNAIEVGNAQPPGDTTKSPRVKAAMIAHCKADAWGDEVLACYGDAVDNEHLATCIDNLTKDQQDKLMKDLAPIMADSKGAP